MNCKWLLQVPEKVIIALAVHNFHSTLDHYWKVDEDDLRMRWMFSDSEYHNA
jgi:hypothetical protein